jgi:putative inorganic carbon (HCO3(-)) transporter
MVLIFLVYVILAIVRPQEYVESLEDLDLLRYVLLFAFVLWMLKSPKTLSAPQQLLVPLFAALAVLSRAALGWFGGVVMALQELLPLIMMFYVCASVAEDPGSLRSVLKTMCLSALVLVAHGVNEVLTDGHSWTGREMFIWPDGHRIQYIGPFNDPNDLAMLFAACLPMAMYLALESASRLIKLLWWCAAGMFSYGVFLTNSRGGLLAVVSVVGLWSMRRLGRVTTGVIAAISLPTLFAATRLAGMSADEESAAGRVDAWYTALQLFVSRPITGVGMGLFTEHNSLTAHNSWMLVLAELGFFGYVVWFCLAGFSIQQMYVVGHYVAAPAAKSAAGDQKRAGEPHVEPLGLALFYTSVGMLVSAFFLSRSYTFLFFMYWGFCTGLYNGARARNPGLRAVGGQEFGRQWAIAAVASIPAFYILIRVLLVIDHD